VASAEATGIFSILATLLVGPPIGIIAARLIRSYVPMLAKPSIMGSAAIIAIVILCRLFKIGWLDDLMNVLSVALAYLAYCLIFGFVWTKDRSEERSRLVKYTAFPILLGYFLGTVGGLGLAWAMSEKLGLSQGELRPAPGLLCRHKRSDEFDEIIIYRYFRILPLVGREERRVAVSETDPGGELTNASCKRLATGLY